jgi:hypothetical protein
MVQMLINRKALEIKEMSRKMHNSEVDAVNTEVEIKAAVERCKVQNAATEQRLAKARKACEAAGKRRVDLVSKWKHAVASVGTIKSEISRHQEVLENYRTYREFMEALLPEGKTIEEFYTSPRVVGDELAAMERGCHSMITVCQAFDDHLDRSTSALDHQIEDMDEVINGVKEKHDGFRRSCPPIDPQRYVFRGQKWAEQTESRLARVSELVKMVYERCFKKESHLAPLGMLTDLENTLDEFHQAIVLIDPDFIAQKEAATLKLRREEQRRIKQEKQAIEQARKREQALERACKPVKRKTGRPLVRRGRPVRREKKYNEQFLAQKREQARIEELLYGETFEPD